MHETVSYTEKFQLDAWAQSRKGHLACATDGNISNNLIESQWAAIKFDIQEQVGTPWTQKLIP